MPYAVFCALIKHTDTAIQIDRQATFDLEAIIIRQVESCATGKQFPKTILPQMAFQIHRAEAIQKSVSGISGKAVYGVTPIYKPDKPKSAILTPGILP